MWRRWLVALVLGAVASAGCAFVVEDHEHTGSSGNRAPDVSVTVQPQQPEIGERVTLDASGSSDPEGDTIRFRYLVRNADGEVVHRTSSYEGSTSFRPRSAGTYRVKLVGVDEHGAERSVSATVEPRNHAPRVEVYWALHVDGERSTYGSGEGCVEAYGVPADELVVAIDRIRDPEGHATEVEWELRSAPTGQTGSCRSCGERSYALPMTEPGGYELRAVVRDEYGATTTVSCFVQKSR